MRALFALVAAAIVFHHAHAQPLCPQVKPLALEAGPAGIRVNAIAPGATVTPFTARHAYAPDGTLDESRYEAFVGYMRKLSPLGIVGEPEDQANLILYLVSDAARFCTGVIWRANGGQTFSW